MSLEDVKHRKVFLGKCWLLPHELGKVSGDIIYMQNMYSIYSI